MSRYLYIIVFAAATLLGSCSYDELCEDHPHWPTIEVQVDLSETDMSADDVALSSYMARFYPIDDGIMPLEDLYADYSYRMQSWADYFVKLPRYSFKALIYSDYILSKLRFRDIDNFDNIYVEGYSSKLASNSYSKESGLLYTAEPAKTVTGHYDLVDVNDGGISIDGASLTHKLKFKTTRITQELKLDIYMTNSGSVSYMEGNVGEVNGRYYLTQERANSGGCCIKFNNTDDNMVLIATSLPSTQFNHLCHYELTVNTFGFTQAEEGPKVDAVTGVEYNNPATNAVIYFTIRLKGDEGYRYANIDVTEHIKRIEWGDDYHITLKDGELGSSTNPIILPEIIDDEESDNSGFKPEVGGWGDENEFEVGAGDFEVVTSN